MSISGFIIGSVAGLGFFITNSMASYRISYIFYIIDWFNWFTLPLAFTGFGLCLVGAIKGPHRVLGTLGALLCAGIAVLSISKLV